MGRDIQGSNRGPETNKDPGQGINKEKKIDTGTKIGKDIGRGKEREKNRGKEKGRDRRVKDRNCNDRRTRKKIPESESPEAYKLHV